MVKEDEDLISTRPIRSWWKKEAWKLVLARTCSRFFRKMNY
jgi:hypothetical protein